MKIQKAQALLELAILGVILLTISGVVINFGLRYNFQQQIMQQTFRKALGIASTGIPESKGEAPPSNPQWGQASYIFIKDRHIPEPTHPFGLGAFIPNVSSASITRSYTLQETADTVDELPQLTINIPTCTGDSCQDQLFSYKTVGFRDICDDPDDEDKMRKYEEIYGGNNVWEEESASCGSGNGGIRVIDSCEGEIMTYDGCKRQCRMITDISVCIKECQNGRINPDSGADKCSEICQPTIETPWYCAKLEQLFGFAIAHNKPKIMGLQQDYSQTTRMDNVLSKLESPAGITTTDVLNWSNTSQRIIIYRAYGDISGNTAPPQEVESRVSQDETETWQTNWENPDEDK